MPLAIILQHRLRYALNGRECKVILNDKDGNIKVLILGILIIFRLTTKWEKIMASPPELWMWFQSIRLKKTSVSCTTWREDLCLRKSKPRRLNTNFAKWNLDLSDPTKSLISLLMTVELSDTLILKFKSVTQLNWTCRKIRLPNSILSKLVTLFTLPVVTMWDVLDKSLPSIDILVLSTSFMLKMPEVSLSPPESEMPLLLDLLSKNPLSPYLKKMEFTSTL